MLKYVIYFYIKTLTVINIVLNILSVFKKKDWNILYVLMYYFTVYTNANCFAITELNKQLVSQLIYNIIINE